MDRTEGRDQTPGRMHAWILRTSAAGILLVALLVQGAVAADKPRNELPSTRPVGQPATIVVRGSSGFSWTDGAIGLVAGLGIAIVGVGVGGLARGTQRGTRRTAL